MRGTRIGTLFGIGLHVHWSFALLVAWIGLAAFFAGGWVTALYTLALLAGLFTSVVLHELGHCLAAGRYGIGTRSITLYPIGGVAQLAAMPRDPRQELVIALAGPAVNVGIIVILAPVAVVLGFFGGSTPAALAAPTSVPQLVEAILAANLIMVLFNLIPAFPMDGGRVLRALLAMRGSYFRATHVAARLGQGCALLFVLAGLLTPASPMLIFIGAFIFFAAGAERRMAQMERMWGYSMPQGGGVNPWSFTGSGAGRPRTVYIRDDEWEVLPPR